jgi:F0F1-type ATP synthase membrane subunit c/vacuolar-type H+-ATPase subunit K
MQRLTKSVVLVVAALAVGLPAAGCGAASSISSAIRSAAPSITVPTLPSNNTSPTVPPTTVPPTTVAPTTVPPTTVPPTTAAPSTPPSISPTPTSSTSSSLVWLWVLLAAIVIIGVIVAVIVARRSGRQSSIAGVWRPRVIDAYSKGAALYDAISVAERSSELSAADSGARWYDIQHRMDDLTQELYAMRESAPDEDERARVSDVLGSLQALRSAMEAERAPGGAGPDHAEVVRSRLYAFDSALQALRPPDLPPR